MNDLLQSIFSSDSVNGLLKQAEYQYILYRYPWLPVVIILVVGILVTLIVLLCKKRKPVPAPDPKPGDSTRTEPCPEPQSAPRPAPVPQPTPAKRESSRELECVSGVLAGKSFLVQGKVHIGRDGRRCQIAYPVDTKNVSAVHCTVSFDGIKATVKDENSTRGTMVDGRSIPAGKPVTVHRGQKISIGSEANSFILKGHSAH